MRRHTTNLVCIESRKHNNLHNAVYDQNNLGGYAVNSTAVRGLKSRCELARGASDVVDGCTASRRVRDVPTGAHSTLHVRFTGDSEH
jgi:hypothetical protein